VIAISFLLFQQHLPVGKRQPVQCAERSITQLQLVVVMPERVTDTQECGVTDGCGCQEILRWQFCIIDDVFNAPVTGFHQGV